MKAQKDRKTGKWLIQFRYTDWQGVRRKTTKRGFATKREAEEYVRNFFASQQADFNMAFEEFLKLYYEDMEPRLRVNTMKNKKYIIDLKILPYFAKKSISSITAADIRKWQNELIAQGYSQTYLRTINNQLTAIFNYAVKYYDLKNNPCRKAGSMGKNKADEMQFWTKEEFSKFIDGIMDKQKSYTAFMTLFWTGMRLGELLALTPTDIDFEHKTISISKSYQRIDSKDVITPPKTPKGRRIITVPDFLLADIRDYMDSIYCLNDTDRLLTDTAELSAFWGENQEDESKQVVDKIQGLLRNNANTKIAILCRGRNQNAIVIENELAIRDIKYFYGMFTDEDRDYISFHIKCQELFVSRYGKSKSITRKSLTSFVESLKKAYETYQNKTISSLIALLEALVEKVAVDYAGLSQEEKYSLLMDIFENRQLKQAMEYVDTNVVITTIHGAKGLEWEYVFLPDVERWIFPSFFTCKDCSNRFINSQNYRCTLPDSVSVGTMNSLLDELSVFYVGVTRARKQVYVSASGIRYNNDGAKSSVFSCLVNINGIKLVDASKTDL